MNTKTDGEHNDRQAWIFIATLENWQIAQDKGLFGCHGNRSLLSKIRKGDYYVAFVPKIGFIGYGTIMSEHFVSNIKLWTDKAYNHRFQISTPIISDKVLPAAAVVDDLTFVTDKKRWEVFFRSEIREIPFADYKLISNRISKSVAVLSEMSENVKQVQSSQEIGDELHNRVVKLFENLGFNIVDNNYYTAGPDIIVIDPEDSTKSRIIIQCKNSKQEKKTFSNLDKHLNEYSGRLKTGNAHKAIIVIAGHELPEKVPGENGELNVEDILQKYGVAIWTSETIEYYEDLIDKISHFARYQVLSDLGMKLDFSNSIETDSIELTQNGFTMYATALDPDWLLRTVSVARRINAADGPKGYQRLLNKSRIANTDKPDSISNYLDANSDWIFPNAIVLASSRNSKMVYDKGKLHLNSKYGEFWVIDGQHRLFAFANANARLKGNKLLCVIVDVQSLGSEKDEERELAQIFVTLNGRAKRVPKALLYELYRLLGSKDNPELEVVLRLAEKDFFAGDIRGYSDKGGSINLTAFADAKGTSAIYEYFKGKQKKKADEQVIGSTAEYILGAFKSVAKVFSLEWKNPDEYFLKTDRGIKGMLVLFHLIIGKYGADLAEVDSVLNALKEEGFDFSSETAKGLYLGAGGPDLLAEAFAKYITRRIPDFSPKIFSKEIDRASNERGEIAEEKIVRWIGELGGDVRCHMPHIDKSTIRYLSYLNVQKVNKVRMFFAKCEKGQEKEIKTGLATLRDKGLNITVTQENKRTIHGGSIIHERFIGDDKHGFITDADLKDQSQRNTIMHLHFYQWNEPAELDTFDRYWDAAEKTKDVQFGYDWDNTEE